ncbi:transposase [Amycolatopsis sp. K13G38]|uniref:Transposase n=1 Tax=Amycolatopsis acididurans TaxID=2724524 RepID=A0ABX1JEX5_9PSEU|nr:transposase [Amycolatopsis acididurans]NKQ57414.1 transposase [Amycolatopsis acididurans]
MASIVGKRINGRTYYYLVTSERVAGKPRISEQRYLGSAADVAAALDGGGALPEHTKHLNFGAVAAVWATLEQLQVAEAIDEAISRRGKGPETGDPAAGTAPARIHAARAQVTARARPVRGGGKGGGKGRGRPSPGMYLALAVLHRATAPGSTFAEWWGASAVQRFIRPRLPADAVTDDEFWRATRRLTRDQLQRIEEAVSSRITAALPGAAALAVDIPGFATYAQSDTAAATLAGLSAIVTRDGAIPLVSHVYRRDSAGMVPFGVEADRLAARHPGPVTVVFDTGQHAQLDLDSGLHFVGALPLGDYPDLLSRPASGRRPVDPLRFAGLTALDTRALVFGTHRRVVLTHSARLHAAQARGFAQALSNATRQLDGLALALATGRNRRPREQLLTDIARITRVRAVDRVLTARLTGTKPGELRLEYRIDETARTRLAEEYFGKQLLVTDHDDWPVLDVITAYRARYHLDSTFRVLNSAFVAAPAPRWDWTEHRIAVHSLVSVLATAVTHLLRQEADRAGVDLSVRELLDQLSGIGETVLRYPSTGGRPRTRRVLTSLSPTQQHLYELFGLGRLAP